MAGVASVRVILDEDMFRPAASNSWILMRGSIHECRAAGRPNPGIMSAGHASTEPVFSRSDRASASGFALYRGPEPSRACSSADRASASEAEGRRSESCRARQTLFYLRWRTGTSKGIGPAVIGSDPTRSRTAGGRFPLLTAGPNAVPPRNVAMTPSVASADAGLVVLGDADSELDAPVGINLDANVGHHGRGRGGRRFVGHRSRNI